MACAPILSEVDLSRFRTKPCRRSRREGCSFGRDRCQYSHNDYWPRRCPFYHSERNSIRYVPLLCEGVTLGDKDIIIENKCKRGGSCPFSHSTQEIEYHPLFYKTQICQNYKDGECQNYYCPYIHGLAEKRRPGPFNLPFTKHDEIPDMPGVILSKTKSGGGVKYGQDEDSENEGERSLPLCTGQNIHYYNPQPHSTAEVSVSDQRYSAVYPSLQLSVSTKSSATKKQIAKKPSNSVISGDNVNVKNTDYLELQNSTTCSYPEVYLPQIGGSGVDHVPASVSAIWRSDALHVTANRATAFSPKQSVGHTNAHAHAHAHTHGYCKGKIGSDKCADALSGFADATNESHGRFVQTQPYPLWQKGETQLSSDVHNYRTQTNVLKHENNNNVPETTCIAMQNLMCCDDWPEFAYARDQKIDLSTMSALDLAQNLVKQLEECMNKCSHISSPTNEVLPIPMVGFSVVVLRSLILSFEETQSHAENHALSPHAENRMRDIGTAFDKMSQAMMKLTNTNTTSYITKADTASCESFTEPLTLHANVGSCAWR